MSEKSRVVFHIAIPIAIPNSNKSQWTRVGVIIKSASGKMFGKINFRPMKEWDGGFSLFEPERERGAKAEFPSEAGMEAPPPEMDETGF